jgi:hypothetical protein
MSNIQGEVLHQYKWRNDSIFQDIQGFETRGHLSLLIFNLVAEVLSTLMRKAADQGKITEVMSHLIHEGITHI